MRGQGGLELHSSISNNRFHICYFVHIFMEGGIGRVGTSCGSSGCRFLDLLSCLELRFSFVACLLGNRAPGLTELDALLVIYQL